MKKMTDEKASPTGPSSIDPSGTSPLVFIIPGVVTGAVLVICIVVTLCICGRYRGWCAHLRSRTRQRQPQKQEIERIKSKIISQYRRRKRKSRKNDVIPDVIDCTLVCAICLDGYVSTISKRHRMLAQLMQCGHHFHFNCIFQWLDRNQSCPVCRTPVSLSDEKIKAVELQDICNLEKPVDLMPVCTHDQIAVSVHEHVSRLSTPSPRLLSSYLQAGPTPAPSVGTNSTFSTLSSVRSQSNTVESSSQAVTLSPTGHDINEPQPSTSTNSGNLLSLAINNLPTLSLNNAQDTKTLTVIPSPPSQDKVVVNVEFNTLAASFYNEDSSSASSQSEPASRRHSVSSSSSSSSMYASARNSWIHSYTPDDMPTDSTSSLHIQTQGEDICAFEHDTVLGRVLYDHRGHINLAFENDGFDSQGHSGSKPNAQMNPSDTTGSPNCNSLPVSSIQRSASAPGRTSHHSLPRSPSLTVRVSQPISSPARNHTTPSHIMASHNGRIWQSISSSLSVLGGRLAANDITSLSTHM